MPSPTQHRLHRRSGSAAFIAGVALLTGLLPGCSTGGKASETPAATISAQLARIPDTADTRSYIAVTIYDRAEVAAGVADGRERTKSQEQNRAKALNLAGLADTSTFELAGQPFDDAQPLGYPPSATRAEIVAGEAPNTFDVAVGSFDGTTSGGQGGVLDLAATVKGTTRPEVNGVATVRWLDDDEFSADQEPPVGAMAGQPGRLAFTGDGVLAYTHTDEAMRQIIDVEKEGATSLDDDDDLHAIAQHLDTEGVYGAILRAEPITAGPPDLETGTAARGVLGPYRGIGVGVAGTTKQPRLVIVLTHASENDARANLAAMRTAVAASKNPRGQLYRDTLGRPRYAQDGTTVVASFDIQTAGLWQSFVLGRDPLVATG